MKTKTCKVCEVEFQPRKPLQSVCTIHCAIEQSREKQRKAADKAFRKKHKLDKERIKTRSQWLREAQTAFNRYIRARDYNKCCVSSGRRYQDIVRGGRMDAGHYRSIGAASHQRFHLLNCWAQSVKDNRDLSGNIVEYRKELINRIGIDRVEALENDNTPRKFDIEYLKRIKRIFNKRARYYEKRRENQ